VEPLRIANCSGFYGDRRSAPRELLEGGGIDVLTGDYLAELTMLILWRSRSRDPALGYATSFLAQMEECLGLAMDNGVKVVTNAGGLNPAGLAALRDQLDTYWRQALTNYAEVLSADTHPPAKSDDRAQHRKDNP